MKSVRVERSNIVLVQNRIKECKTVYVILIWSKHSGFNLICNRLEKYILQLYEIYSNLNYIVNPITFVPDSVDLDIDYTIQSKNFTY